MIHSQSIRFDEFHTLLLRVMLPNVAQRNDSSTLEERQANRENREPSTRSMQRIKAQLFRRGKIKLCKGKNYSEKKID